MPASSDDPVADQFVQALRRVCSGATLELALDVGRLVVDTFYGGDVRLWRTRPRAHPSLRRLAKRHDLPISVPRLYRCVAIYELSRRLPAFSTWKHLGASHVRAVLGIAEDDQRRLLDAAERGKWTVQRLEAEVDSLRSARRARRGRPPHSERWKRLLSLQRWLADCPEPLPAIDPGRLDGEMRADLCARALAVRDRCSEIEAALRAEDAKSSAETTRRLRK